jgi:Flavodoxins
MKTRVHLIVITLLLFAGMGIQAQSTTKAKKVLIVYYSYSGNTQVIAKQIQKDTGGDLFEIQTVKAYPKEYKAVVDQARKEVDSNYKPALRTKLQDISKYDVIFVGSPCWWSTIAPPVRTFLSGYNLSGKTIVPFMTHEGSGMGRSEADIRKLCPKSTVLNGLPIQGSQVNAAGNEVMKWLKKTGMLKK